MTWQVAQLYVDNGYVQPSQREFVAQAMKELPYGRWREYNAEDTVRFYALRLHEANLIKASPEGILTEGTNWQFLDELKRELKS